MLQIIVYRINQGSYIFPATLHLMGVVIDYIQSTSDSHTQALKCLLELLLFVFSAVIDHKIPYPSDKKVPDPSDHKVPDPSDHKIPDPPDHKVPDPSDHKIPDPSDHKVPDPSDHKIPDPSDHKIPDPSNDKVPDPSVGITKINNLLMGWIAHYNVIGGKCFGGSSGQKLKEELKVSILHMCFVHAYLIYIVVYIIISAELLLYVIRPNIC